jgi:hypothetical protein
MEKHRIETVELICDQLRTTPEELAQAFKITKQIARAAVTEKWTDVQIVNCIQDTNFQPQVKHWMAFKFGQALVASESPLGFILKLIAE